MIEREKVLCLIPARGGSKGLHRKNIRLLCGRPLVAWPVSAALASRHVGRVVVSTDDQEIAKAAVSAGAEVPFLRPAELAADSSTALDVILHVLDRLAKDGREYEYLVYLEPTSPLTEAADVDLALECLVAAQDRADSIVGVSNMVGTHPAFSVRLSGDGLLRPYLDDAFKSSGRRQDLDVLHFMDGSLYISSVEALRRRRGFYHDRTLAYVTPKWKSLEVDDIVDWVCVEAIMRNRELFRVEDRCPAPAGRQSTGGS